MKFENGKLTAQVVVVKCNSYGSLIFCNAELHQDSTAYTAVSEPVEVTFTERDKVEVISAEVKSIDSAIESLYTKIKELADKKQELLSITFQETSDE